MAKICLVLGGARSGKSSFGEELASSLPGKTGYLATPSPQQQVYLLLSYLLLSY